MLGFERVIGQISWRQAVVAACAVLLSSVAFAGIEDKVVKFSASGIDRYADGSVVVDGECYALVWSPKGSVFAGFNADGTVVSPNDRLVLAAPLAKIRSCRASCSLMTFLLVSPP